MRKEGKRERLANGGTGTAGVQGMRKKTSQCVATLGVGPTHTSSSLSFGNFGNPLEFGDRGRLFSCRVCYHQPPLPPFKTNDAKSAFFFRSSFSNSKPSWPFRFSPLLDRFCQHTFRGVCTFPPPAQPGQIHYQVLIRLWAGLCGGGRSAKPAGCEYKKNASSRLYFPFRWKKNKENTRQTPKKQKA